MRLTVVNPTSREEREKWGNRLKRRSSTVVLGPMVVLQVKVKTNVKSNGQECPFHTGGEFPQLYFF